MVILYRSLIYFINCHLQKIHLIARWYVSRSYSILNVSLFINYTYPEANKESRLDFMPKRGVTVKLATLIAASVIMAPKIWNHEIICVDRHYETRVYSLEE